MTIKQPDLGTDKILVVFKVGDQSVKGARDFEILSYIDPDEWSSGQPEISDHMATVFGIGIINQSYKSFIKNCINLNSRNKDNSSLFRHVMDKSRFSEDYVASLRSKNPTEVIDISDSFSKDWVVTKDFTDEQLVADTNAISSGSYTIGSGGDYTTVTAFISDCTDLTGDLTGTLISDVLNSGSLNIDIETNSYTYTITSDSISNTIYYSRVWAGFRITPASTTSGSYSLSNFTFVRTVDANEPYRHSFGVEQGSTNADLVEFHDIIVDLNGYQGTSFTINNINVPVRIYNCVIINCTHGEFGVIRLQDAHSGTVIENVTGYNNNTPLINGVNHSFVARNCVGFEHTAGDVFENISYAEGYNNASDDDSVDDSNWDTGSGNITNIVPEKEFESLDSLSSNFLLPRIDSDLNDGATPSYATEYMNGITMTSPYWIGAKGLSHSSNKEPIIRNIQKGESEIGSTDTLITVPIHYVDTSKSILLFSVVTEALTSDPPKFQIAGYLNSSTELVFERGSTNTTNGFIVRWQVVEFRSGVNVQHGTKTLTLTSEDTTISTVDTTKAFPIITVYQDGGTSLGSDDFVEARITSSTNLRFLMGTSDSITVAWQVVEFTGGSLVKKSGSTDNYISGTTESDGTTDITLEKSVDLTKTIVFGSYQADGDVRLYDLLVYKMLDSSTLRLYNQRDSSAPSLDYTFYVFEFDSGADVQHISETIGNVTEVESINSPVDLKRSVVVTNGYNGTFASIDRSGYEAHEGMFGSEISTPSLVKSNRGTSDYTGNIELMSISFDRFDDNDYWSYSKFIKIDTTSDAADVSTTQTNFPLLIKLDSSNFTFSEANSDGSDIRFLSRNGDLLDYEIESWDNSLETAEIWVSIPEIRARAHTYIKMLWGNESAISLSNSEKVFASSYGYKSVFHFNEGSGTFAYDATDLNNNAVASTSGLFTSAGQIDGAIDLLNANEDRFETNTDVSALNIGGNQAVLHAWINMASLTTGYRAVISKSPSAYEMIVTDSKLWFECTVLTSTEFKAQSTEQPLSAADVWKHAVIVRDGSTINLYVDGTKLTTDYVTSQSSNDFESNTDALKIGSRSSSLFWDGKIDETQVIEGYRDDGWVKLCYENQKDSQTVWSFHDGF